MKHLRVWVLLLLIVLLPARGAMAAAMLCPPSNGAGHVQASHLHGSQVQASHLHESQVQASHLHESLVQASPVQAHERGGSSVHSETAAADDCNLCASSCTLTLLAPAPFDLRHPQAGAALFPTSALPGRSHVPDGDERPPRTL